MKTKIFLSALFIILGNCASMGFTYDEKKLKNTASFDNDCPVEKIELLKTNENGLSLGGNGNFLLNVCGQKMKYKRYGTIYKKE